MSGLQLLWFILIGVYRFFFEFGVRFLRPNAKNEVVPQVPWEDFAEKTLQIAEEASYKHRGTCIEGSDSFENIVDFIDWMPKIGLNSFFIQFENPYDFMKKWYQHVANPYAKEEDFSEKLVEQWSQAIDEEMAKRGIIHHRVGHGWTSQALGYSSKYGWDKAKPLPEEKKSLVAELKGKRELFYGAPMFTNLDYSNQDVKEIMSDQVVEYAKNHPEVDVLHVWLADAINNVCECSKCQKEVLADQYIKIINLIDEKLTKAGLATRICFLLYNELIFPPEKEQIKNPSRFTMMFAPISRTFEASYADVKEEDITPKLPTYERNRFKQPTKLEDNLAYLRAWQKHFTGDSFVYDYHLGRAHYGDLGYMAISKLMYRDCQYLDHLDLDGMLACQELRCGFPHNFPTYVMGQTLWNKEVSYDKLKETYFEGLYGEQWEKAVHYLEEISQHASANYVVRIEPRVNTRLAVDFQIAVNLAKDFLSDLSKEITNHHGFEKEQWKILSLHRKYVMGLGKAFQLLAAGSFNEAQETWREFVNYIRLIEPLVQKELDVYRVTEVTRNYVGFKFYD